MHKNLSNNGAFKDPKPENDCFGAITHTYLELKLHFQFSGWFTNLQSKKYIQKLLFIRLKGVRRPTPNNAKAYFKMSRLMTFLTMT